MFCYNKYYYIYNSIITNSKLQYRNKENSYYESHHIIPKCMGGEDDSCNLVLLTAREHYICHHLLTKFTNHDKIHYAFWAMCNQSNSNQERNYIVTSHIYEKAKIKFSQLQSKRLMGIKPKYTMTDEHRMKLKERMKNSNPSYMPHVRKLASVRMSEKLSTDNPMDNKSSRLKASKSKLGLNNPMSIGIYVTPWGEFESSKSASDNSPVKINPTTVLSYCKNCDKLITKHSTSRSSILTDRDIGKTFREVGFYLS